jgi:hydroxymethylpyrimidine/phosphomethylpyrimidine kinase
VTKDKIVRIITIAGFDSSAGAGIQADLKSFAALGCYGMTVLTALPVQNSCGVKSIYPIPEKCVEEQLEGLLEDIGADAIKIGMLHRKEVVEATAAILERWPHIPVVLDPVMSSTSGTRLLEENGLEAMRRRLFPRVSLITPNLSETALLVGREVKTKKEMERAALEIVAQGARGVVVKGGHLESALSEDLLHVKGEKMHWFSSPRIESQNTRGTGCTFSAALAAFIGMGLALPEATWRAKEFLSECLVRGASLKIGKGHGPVLPFY